jgi:hypothetical protein
MPSTKSRNTFFCFSPPVMVATCVIELALLAYTIWRYRLTTLTRLVSLMLLFLAIFQLAEFHVCRGSSWISQWSHLGYIAITLLPPLGIHIIHTIAGRAKAWLVYACYVTAAAFVAFFAITANSITGHQCLGNYVMFQVNPGLTDFYGLYYYGWVLAGIALSLYFAQGLTLHKRQSLHYFAFGYAAFLVPTTTANLIDSATLRGIPSIMCGFAVILALVAVLCVMPKVGPVRQSIPKEKTSE